MSLFARSMHHRLMRSTDNIKIVGYNGDECHIAGPMAKHSWGPLLAPHSKGLFAAPFKTNWSKSMLGQKYSSWAPQRRDIACTMHIVNRDTGEAYLDRDADTWHLIYSRYRAMFHPDFESTIVYTSIDGERHLGVREIKDPEPFVGAEFEGGDPHIWAYGSVGQMLGCENPYYVGPTERFAWETSMIGDFWFTLPYYNPASVMCWPKWYLSDNAEWTLPDYSFGWEEYGSGIADLGKTYSPGPFFDEGGLVEADSRPDVMTLVAANGNPVQQRSNGQDLEYPIQPGMGDPYNGCTVTVRNVTNPDGARCELELPRWFNDPFSTPTVVGTSVGVGAV